MARCPGQQTSEPGLVARPPIHRVFDRFRKKKDVSQLNLPVLYICWIPLKSHYHLLNLSLLTLLLLCNSTISAAPVTASKDSVVQNYQQRLARIQLELRTANVHRTALQKRLEQIRQRIHQVDAQEEQTSEKAPPLSTTIDLLQRDISELGQLLKEQRRLLAVNLKLLTEQPKPSVLADALGQTVALDRHRKIAFTRYMVHRSSNTVKETIEHRDALLNQKNELLRSNAVLLSSLKDLTNNRDDLQQLRQSLEQEFSELTSQIVSKQDALDSFTTRLSEIEDNPDALVFTHHQGTLPDPVSGQLLRQFAEPKARGLLKWEGILISALPDQPIKSVFDGDVVFADQIQGLGNVAIVDHGEGYMSLYGAADFLVVESGQHVLSGDVLGVVGESVGIGASTLYFEVRHNAATIDPLNWLAMENISLKD